MAVIINGSSGVTTPGISNSEGYTGDGLTIAAGAPSGAVQVDTSGNLGLGVTPSANWSSSYSQKAFQIGPVGAVSSLSASAGNSQVTLSNNVADLAVGAKYLTSDYASFYKQVAGTHAWFTAPSGTAGNAISFTQAMTLDASGSLIVGATSGLASVKIQGYANVNHDAFYAQVPTGSLGGSCYVGQIWNTQAFFAYWAYNGSQVGYIRTNGTSTTYATSSDYRLKENIQPMTGALAKVAALKPCTYKWNADGSDGEGFIAHELAEVVPACVTGEKDAVDAEGKPVYQGIDTSFLVATLTAAIQELKAQVDAQAVEIAALKGQA